MKIDKKTLSSVGILTLQKFLHTILIITALSFTSKLYGQNDSIKSSSANTIKGVVLDARTKKPIEAVQIQALNNVAAATSNENGEFEIDIYSSSEVLLVKAFFYNAREVAVRGKSNLEIELFPESFSDLYPVIEGISGAIRSSSITNATVGMDKIDVATYASSDNVIQNNMGGHLRAISKSGSVGSGQSIFIRGLNSINLNSQPLYVVDGVIWNNFYDLNSIHDGYINNTIANINLNDIASISVIKDGTSIYGSKGSNGVILIKTKKGVDISTKIEVNAIGGITEAPKSLPVMDGDQFRLYTTDLFGTYEFMSTESVNELDYLQDDPSDLDYNKYHNNTDWDKQVYQKGSFQNYNISVNGGDQRALYALSVGYTGSQGVIKNTNLQRLSTRFNADFFLSDYIDLGLNIGYTNMDRIMFNDGVNYLNSPTFEAMTKAQFLSPYSYTATGTLTADVEDSDIFGTGNPTAIIQNSSNDSRQYRLNMGMTPQFKLSPTLTLSHQFEYNLYKLSEQFYSPIVGVQTTYLTEMGYSNNYALAQKMRNNGIFNDTRLYYENKFGSSHKVKAIAGWRYITDFYELDFGEGHNSGSDQIRWLTTSEEFKQTAGVNNQIKSISNYANVDYSFENKYFLTTTLSIDGSSRFGRETQGGFQLFNHSWGIFPSANAAWLLSSEEFMTGASFIDMLKVRAGYGITGNDAFDPYAWSAYFTSINYMNRANGLIIANIGNPEIQWESTSKLSLGIDAIVLNDKVSLSVDLFSNKTKDLLVQEEIPEHAGSGYYWKNSGELSNKGVELSTQIKLLNLNKLTWEVGASIGRYKNNIESLPEGDIISSFKGAEIITTVGQAAGVFWGYETDGVLSSEAEAETADLSMINAFGIEDDFSAGDMHFVDQNDDGVIDDSDKTIIGDPNPDLYGSFNNKFAYGRFKLDAVFSFSYGNDIYNYLRSELESGSEFINQTTAMLNRWTYEGQVTNQPKAVYGDPMGNARFSDRWIEDGSYLRLKSLSLSYQVPINLGFIEGITLWTSVNNLFTLTNYLGRDPEVSAVNSVLFQGIDTGLIPTSRSFYLGIKMNL